MLAFIITCLLLIAAINVQGKFMERRYSPRARRSLTTICVEIKPSGPKEQPYLMCKDADLMKSTKDREGNQRPSQYGPPPESTDYGGSNFQQSAYNDNPFQSSYNAPSTGAQNGQYSQQHFPLDSYNKHNPTSTFSFPSPASQKPSTAYDSLYEPSQHPTTAQESSTGYGDDSFRRYVGPKQAPNAGGSYANSQGTYPSSEVSRMGIPAFNGENYPNNAASNGENYANKQTTNDGNYAASKAANNAASNGGKYPNQQTSNGASYNTGNSAGNYPQAKPTTASYAPSHESNTQTQPSTGTVSSSGDAKNPYVETSNLFGRSFAANPIAPATATYGAPRVFYANPRSTSRAGLPTASGASTAPAAGAYVAPTAKKPSSAQQLTATPNYINAAAVGDAGTQPAYNLLLGTRFRPDFDEDVMQMPSMGFRPAEFSQFNRGPAFGARTASNLDEGIPLMPVKVSPMSTFSGAEGPMPPQQNLPIEQLNPPQQLPIAYMDDPIIRTFYGLDAVPTEKQRMNDMVGQAYSGMSPFGGYPNNPYSPSKPPYARPPPVTNLYAEEPATCNGYAAPPSVCAPAQQCIAASDNGANTYASLAPPPPPTSTCAHDYNFQPIFIALPCYGQQQPQQPNGYLGSPAPTGLLGGSPLIGGRLRNGLFGNQNVPMLGAPPPNPMVGAPFGPFGMLNPFGLHLFHPFGGLLGAPAPETETEEQGEPKLGARNPFSNMHFGLKGKASVGKAANQAATQRPANSTIAQAKKTLEDSVSLESNEGVDPKASIQLQLSKSQGTTAANQTNIDTATPNLTANRTTTESGDTVGDSRIFEDAQTESEDISAKTYLDMAEEKLSNDKPAEPKPSAVIKRQNMRPLNGQMKRKYLQKL